MSNSILSIFPQTAKVDSSGHLIIGGCDTVKLADEYGTPLYIFDEVTLRGKCAEFCMEFGHRYADTLVIYACKAFVNRPLAAILEEEGLGLDVCSGGELAIARAIAFPMERVYFHGNNKTRKELEMALELGVGCVVVDNLHELSLLGNLAGERGMVQKILLRLSPGIDPHTHRYTSTGMIDSKFGFPITTGQAEEALIRATADPGLDVIGLHFHLGSPLFELRPYQEAIRVVIRFASEMRDKQCFQLSEISTGGGFAIGYTTDFPAPAIDSYAEVIVSTLLEEVQRTALDLPRLVVEPGRAIIGQAGVAIYRVGGMKVIPGIRKYIFVDGGMGDNIRPPLYGSRYEALVANKAGLAGLEQVTIAGKFCESGDILIDGIKLPPISVGDVITVPACGAYCLTMASNYNLFPRPAVVLVKEGSARLIRRQETYEDLMRYDVLAGEESYVAGGGTG
jgi:diaminopimelate decarboxylase